MKTQKIYAVTADDAATFPNQILRFNRTLIIVLFLLCSIAVFGQDMSDDVSSDTKQRRISVSCQILIEASASPLVVSSNLLAMDFGGNVGFGVVLAERYGIGAKFAVNYFTAGQDSATDYAGADLDFRLTLFGSFRFAAFFMLHCELGGSLEFSSYRYENNGFHKQYFGGFVARIAPRFFVPKCRYVDFAFIADAAFHFGNGFLPLVYGAARLNVHPYISWLSLFVEAGGQYRRYDDTYHDDSRGCFVLRTGLSFDVSIRHKHKQIGTTGKNVVKDENIKSETEQEVQE